MFGRVPPTATPSQELTAMSGKLAPTNDAQHGVGVHLPDFAQ